MNALEAVLIAAIQEWMNAPVNQMAYAYGHARGVARAVAAAHGVPFSCVWNGVLDGITEAFA